jgi:hypothetical protein
LRRKATPDVRATHGAVAPETVHAALRTPAQALDGPTRDAMEERFGQDFGHVRIHADPHAADSARAVQAQAYTVANDIVFAPGRYAPSTSWGQRLIAHELAHVVQQRRGAGEGVAEDARLEAEARQAADTTTRGRPFPVAGRAGIGIARQGAGVPVPAPMGGVRAPPPPAPVNPFEDPAAVANAAGAAKAMADYQKLGEVERRWAVRMSYKGPLRQVLAQLPASDQVKLFAPQLMEIGRFVEEIATRATAGMSDDQIAAEEAKFLVKQAVDEAAKKSGGAPPTPAQVQQARKAQVAATSIQAGSTAWWGSQSATQQADWIRRGNAAIASIVTYAAAHHPELGLTAAHFNLDFPGTESRGAWVVAAGSPAMVGKAFVESAELNPAYVMDVAVHEIFGHPEYGPYGTEYHLKLYDAAARKIPGYTPPDTTTAAGHEARRLELDAYAYQETEIFAILRSMSYRTAPTTAADAAVVPNLDTQTLVTKHVGFIKLQWSPTVVVALLRGLRQRLAIDPRITPAALAVFDAAVLAKFDAATQTAVAA